MKELTLREIQLSSLKILDYIDALCKKNNLRYFLAYGTLIGAVRHKGFIPWDDDIDIMMPRSDYEKFLKICRGTKSERFKIFTPDDANYPYDISRLSDISYVLDVDNERPYGMGVFVDIYPIDTIARSYKEMKRIKNKASRYSSLYYLATRRHFKIAHTAGVKIFMKLPAFVFAKILGKKFFKARLDEIVRKYSNENGKYVGCLVWGTDGEKGMFKRELLNERVRLLFEGKYYFAPKEYDKILTQLYGDYMKLPPKNKQIPHHDYRAFKK